MDSLTLSPSELGVAAMGSPAVLLGGVTAVQLARKHGPLSARIFAVCAFVLLSIPLVVSVVWLSRAEYSGAQLWHVSKWWGAGIVPTTVFAGLAIAYQYAHGTALEDPFLVLTWVVGAGAMGGFLTGIYDVRQRVEHARHRRTSQRLEALVQASPIAIVSLDRAGHVTEWNAAATQMFGWDASEVVGERYPLVPDAYEREYQEHFERTTSGQELDGVETERRRKDGSLVDVRIWSAPVYDDDGSVARTMVAIVDITERKRRERDLQLFRRAVDQAGHAVMITDATGDIQYVNPAFEEVTGFSETEALGRNPRILKSGKQSEEFYEELWETISAGEVWRAELTNERKSGRLYQVEQTIAPIVDEAGDITHYIAVETDVTDRKRRDQRLAVKERVLRHNLRTAVNVIEGHANLVAESVDDPDLDESLEAIEDNAHALLHLSEQSRQIRTALDDERGEGGGVVDLVTLVEGEVTQLRGAYPNGTIDVEMPEKLFVAADSSLTPAVKEAVENALKHAGERPHVRIRGELDEDADRVRLVITDDGPGIPAPEAAVIERGEETPLRHGSGLGLWLINWVADANGGELRIDADHPRGSALELTLPRARPGEETAAPPTVGRREH